MIFQDNVLKAYLKNVYFITGTHLGGKTTVTRILGERHHIPVYDMDDMFPVHQEISDPVYQPCMNKQFRDADEFFSRSVEEYRGWLQGNLQEQLDFILLDLIIMSRNGPVLCDCHITPQIAAAISDPSRTLFLIKDAYDTVEEYCSRPDHKPFSDYIHSTTDYEKAKAVCNETLYTLNKGIIDEIRASGWYYLERDPARGVEETVQLAEKHFGWI